jgi:hypothetical protein
METHLVASDFGIGMKFGITINKALLVSRKKCASAERFWGCYSHVIHLIVILTDFAYF